MGMLSKQRISDQIKRFGCKEPRFYYRTKTIFNDKLTTVYLIFVPDYVVLAITDPRNVEREELQIIEKIPHRDLAFYKEDNMYLVMKWRKRHLLIGFKDDSVLNKFCEKIGKMDIWLGKKTKKRVLGNDDGESVSYKLDNESIDHISTDTRYEVLSFDDENNTGGNSKKNLFNESGTHSLKSFSAKTYRQSNTSTQAGKNEETCSKLSRDLKKRSREPRKFEKLETKNERKLPKLRFPFNQQQRETEPKAPDEVQNAVRVESVSSVSTLSRKIKAHVEFGKLNFFILSDPDFRAFCANIMMRLCSHFDRGQKIKKTYNIELLEHFHIFIRLNEKLFQMDTETDFMAAIYGSDEKLDIVIENK